MHSTFLNHPFPEKKTVRLSGKIVDEDGTGIQPTALTLTLFDRASQSIINSRTDVNILNANGGTCDANGNWTLTLTPLDMAILDANKKRESHTALIEWTYGAAKEGGSEITFVVDNWIKVT